MQVRLIQVFVASCKPRGSIATGRPATLLLSAQLIATESEHGIDPTDGEGLGCPQQDAPVIGMGGTGQAIRATRSVAITIPSCTCTVTSARWA
jgi:hypothetical protein